MGGAFPRAGAGAAVAAGGEGRSQQQDQYLPSHGVGLPKTSPAGCREPMARGEGASTKRRLSGPSSPRPSSPDHPIPLPGRRGRQQEQERDAYLKGHHYIILRFPNEQVLSD